jgi:hypothetical protein
MDPVLKNLLSGFFHSHTEEAADDNLVSLNDHLAEMSDRGYVEALHDEKGVEA